VCVLSGLGISKSADRETGADVATCDWRHQQPERLQAPLTRVANCDGAPAASRLASR